MSNVISMQDIENKKQLKEWFYINDKGNKVIHKPKLADVVARSTNYKQFKKIDFIYNGKCYEQVIEEEFIQSKIKRFLDGENMNYGFNVITDIIKMMKADNTVSTNNDKRFLSLNNTMIELNTMDMVKHSADNFTTLYVNTNFKEVSEEEYNNSNLNKYLDGVFQGNKDLINQAWEVLGACLLPNPKKFEKCIVLEGEGSNGKSVFLDLVRILAGKGVSSVPFNDIDKNRFALSQMIGKTVNIDSDASGDKLEDTANFKKLCTGDDITIEQKGKDSFSSNLDILLLLAVNKMPLAKDKSSGFARRWNIIPFNSTFVDEEWKVNEKKHIYLKDKELFHKIASKELHILVYKAIEGLQRLKRNNYSLSNSKAVEEATTAYRIKNNNVEGFFLDNKEGKHKYNQIAAKALYEIYREWCENNETSPTTKNQFGAIAKNFCDKKRISGGYVYLDVTLHHDSEWLRQKEYI